MKKREVEMVEDHEDVEDYEEQEDEENINMVQGNMVK